ncbi:MAG: LexA family transcriptional regulator [Faecalibacterium sp.]|nr:LexA family transcriptional regulator [Faecalibacterium sp.]MDY5504680.1 LexA family transcriptional regulator [Faecalibacterium sp.]
MTTGERMKQRRKEIGLSAEKVAERLGVSPATIYRYEKGDIEKVPVDIFAELAKILQTTPAYLMGWEEKPEPKKPTIPPGFEPMPKMKKVPLIGSIACGEPITAEQNIEKMVDVPEYIRCDFSLTCHGDSMVDAGIHDKDVVYIRIQPEVENGEIAAVRIDGEATLKRVYYNPGTLTLMPANPAYAPMVYTGSQLEEVHIEGKAIGWTHWVG